MEQSLENFVALLGRTPGTLDAWLRGLPEAWTLGREGENTWNAFEVVAHMVHTERIAWLPRARHIMTEGEARPFEPLDRSPYQQGIQGKPLAELLDDFARLRAENLKALAALKLQPADLARRGSHPALGPATLSQLLSTWTAHDMTHLHQLARLLACQLRPAVGPFERYLGVLQCAAHSADH